MKAFFYLTLAIFFEVFGSIMLNMSSGFTNIAPSLAVVTGYLLSFVFLGLALHHIALSSAYAIWSGLGTALTAIAGILIFDEHINVYKGLGLLFIIAGVVFLQGSANQEKEKERSIGT